MPFFFVIFTLLAYFSLTIDAMKMSRDTRAMLVMPCLRAALLSVPTRFYCLSPGAFLSRLPFRFAAIIAARRLWLAVHQRQAGRVSRRFIISPAQFSFAFQPLIFRRRHRHHIVHGFRWPFLSFD
jgi:hypothetical protein